MFTNCQMAPQYWKNKKKKHTVERCRIHMRVVCCHYLRTNLFRLFTFCCSFIRVLSFVWFARSFSFSHSLRSRNFVLFTKRILLYGQTEIERLREQMRNLVIILNMVFLFICCWIVFFSLRFVPISASIWQSYSLMSRHETIFQFRKIYNCCARNTL